MLIGTIEHRIGEVQPACCGGLEGEAAEYPVANEPVSRMGRALGWKSTSMRRRLDWIWTGVFPPRCTLCLAPGSGELELCRACAAELPRPGPRCPRCAAPVASPSELPCGACARRPPAFDRVVAPFRYAPPIDFFIQQLKFHERLAMATLLAELFDREATARAPGALIPVPLHAGRLRARGFNQARELARHLAERRGIPLLVRRLLRRRATAPQSELPARRRRNNLSGAFALRGSGPLPAHIALVDDVMTTGATMRACARVLKASGVERVDAWVMARA